MDFDAGDTERECIEGVGDPNSIQEQAETRECRSASTYYSARERLCIFPFYWEGKYYDRCAMDNLLSTDCTPDMFPEYRQAHMTNLVPGMLKK